MELGYLGLIFDFIFKQLQHFAERQIFLYKPSDSFEPQVEHAFIKAFTQFLEILVLNTAF